MTSTQQSFLGRDIREHRAQDRQPAVARSHSRDVSTEIWVQITLCVIVAALMLAVVGIPAPRPAQEAIAGEQAAYALKVTLAELRTSIESFRLEHGMPPREVTAVRESSGGLARRVEGSKMHADAIGRPARELDASEEEVTYASPADLPFWPYLTGSFPTNTINGKATVRVLRPDQEWPNAADDSTGWMYQPATGEIRPNCTGTVFGSEVRYFDL